MQEREQQQLAGRACALPHVVEGQVGRAPLDHHPLVNDLLDGAEPHLIGLHRVDEVHDLAAQHLNEVRVVAGLLEDRVDGVGKNAQRVVCQAASRLPGAGHEFPCSVGIHPAHRDDLEYVEQR